MVIIKFVLMNLIAMTFFYISIRNFLRALAIFFVMAFSFFEACAQYEPEAVLEEEESNSIFSHKGIEASFGMRNFTLESDVTELDRLNVFEEGGSAAFIFGNTYSRIVARLAGLYYSNSATKRTIDLFEVEINSNVYLLKALQLPAKKADAYVMAGLNNQSMKFYGHYIEEADRVEKQRGVGREPFLGSINTTNINIGIGLEYRIQAERDFVHFFAEAKTGIQLRASANIKRLENTSIEKPYAVNMGVRFGRRK
ncbi:hypothetical protein LVD17_08315 [Fulvivirga ulvae]|uniref:hypothetical protein n=1 Tax=Fulvivirga ulvae TaxID=2904245 RepID=UPI001F3BF91F|nr:hypothetical protein [Fulvivirga ulvae]UII33818.1 hypothetical protein LVD17_08315 [Fulvivirga ulvae]